MRQATLFPEPEAPAEPERPTFEPETVFLVSCVSQKLPHAAPARYFYVSDWFKKARAFVEAGGWDWYILSAEYGLVDPADRLSPYDRRVHDMGAKEHWEWSDWIARSLHVLEMPGENPSYAILAGQVYRKWVVPKLTCLSGVTCRVPMQGMGIGQQKAWLSEQTTRLRKNAHQTGTER